MDDIKLSVGGQIELLKRNTFITSASLYGTFNKHETTLVKMTSFGSETSIVSGFYKSNWHIAAELGFNKSIVTNLKHSEALKENLPMINDGWYQSTAGYFFYGVQGSKTIGEKIELSLRLGATNAQGKDRNALLPYYAEVGLLWKM